MRHINARFERRPAHRFHEWLEREITHEHTDEHAGQQPSKLPVRERATPHKDVAERQRKHAAKRADHRFNAKKTGRHSTGRDAIERGKKRWRGSIADRQQ